MLMIVVKLYFDQYANANFLGWALIFTKDHASNICIKNMKIFFFYFISILEANNLRSHLQNKNIYSLCADSHIIYSVKQ